MEKSLFTLLLTLCLGFSSIVNAELFSEDVDFGNTSEEATLVNVGDVISGELTDGDVDWLVFQPTANTKYSVILQNGSSNWKYYQFYQDQGFDDLTSFFGAVGAYHESKNYNLFFGDDGLAYVKIYSGAGSYDVIITESGLYPSDGYGKSPEQATQIIVDAAPIAGTLSTDELDDYEDWFEFSTEPLHQYRIVRTIASNSSSYIYLYNSDGSELLYNGGTDITVTSVHGENYLVRISGNSNTYGNYYELQVIDQTVYSDADGNYYDEATAIVADTKYSSTIDYNCSVHTDDDWFVLNPAGNVRYELQFNNKSTNWKYVYIYQDKGMADLTSVTSAGEYYAQKSLDLFFDGTEPVYFKVTGGLGGYDITVNTTEIFAPDSHPQSSSNPESIAIGSTVAGTISPDQVNNSDWFIIDTQELHKYRVSIASPVNSYVYFEVYDTSDNVIYGANYDMTYIPWQDRAVKIRVVGDRARVGNYYQLTVTDTDVFTDDIENYSDLAPEIAHDGTVYSGEIEYTATVGSDEDCVKFLAPIAGTYNFYIANPVSNWKYYYVYHYDNLNRYTQDVSWGVHNSAQNNTLNLNAGEYYIKVLAGSGRYEFSVLSPEARCGDLEHPYQRADANKDCLVDLEDFAIMAQEWMTSNIPE